MAQAGKGKLNFRCPACFMRDLDIDMFYDADRRNITVCVVSTEVPKKMSFRRMKWQDSVMALCMSVTPNSILIEKTDKAIG